MDKNLINRAFSIAEYAHKNKKDKAGEEYINHPIFVANQMDTEETIILALLHDVVEDSSITIEELSSKGFSTSIIEALIILTRDKNDDYFEYINKIKTNILASKVKLADLKHNSDLTRLANVSSKDLIRQDKYIKAIKLLEKDN